MADNLKVVSSVSLVLDEFLNHVETNIPGVHFIYDERQTIESAITRLRERATINGETDFPILPLFSFRRSVLRYSDVGQGRRSVTNMILPEDRPIDGFSTFKSVYADMDIPFIYYTNNIVDEENFEISYLSENGLSLKKEITVSIPELGDFPYMLRYDSLNDKILNVDDISYKAVVGNVMCRGWYFSASGEGKPIMEIEKRIMNYNERLLESETITP